MMKYFTPVAFFVFFSFTSSAQDKLLSPEEFLGYELGDRFTFHERALDYFRHVATVTPNAQLFSYGETYEGRPLAYLAITSEENFKRLDDIRRDNLRRSGMQDGKPSGEKISIVWLSYNVHGNEASSMEASMKTLYELANRGNAKTQEWLNNTVVILDPCINPDGRDRYANFYNQYGNKPPNPAPESIEHHEPWPGARTNHYFFDLNRDWAWLTQTESQHRIEAYNRWLPHVHVDFHEQGYNSPYYFAPAAEPMHEVISPWQRDFQVMIGKNNAKYFDEKGWLYFTREVFDLFYPSYGDTYPTYSGAIGMTYEQAGGGMGGLTVTTQTGDPLTLRDRITHHHTSGLSTIEITSKNAARVVDEFEKYFRENNNNPAARYKTYVIKAGNNPDKLKQLTAWMDAHAIRYGHPASGKSSRGFHYLTQNIAPVNVQAEDLVVNVFQPKSRFITTVFEPTSHLSDSLTYDITAWNLLYAYHLDAWALTERINPAKPYKPKAMTGNVSGVSQPYAYIFRYESIQDVTLLTALMQSNIKVRAAQRSFIIGGETFGPGALIVTRRNNEGVYGFDDLVTSLARQLERPIYTASTGFVEQGKDLGSGDLNYLNTPNVAVLFGEETSSLSSGEIWHFFEQQLHYPVTLLGTGYFSDVDLRKYDVLVVPDGSYKLFDDATLERLASWVSRGGRLILVANALNSFVDKKWFGLKRYASEEEKNEAEQREKARSDQERFPRYEEVERNTLSENIPGAIYKVPLDNSHPLGFGMRDTYYTLKTDHNRFAFLTNGWNVAYLRENVKPVQGFAGFRANSALKNTIVFGVEQKGSGAVIYLVDNPLFRSFWESGKMIFSNAVFMVGN